MLPDLHESIDVLDDWQAIVCCRGLVLLMDRRMASDTRSKRPEDLTVTDFNQWVQMGGRSIWLLVVALCERKSAFTAATARRLMHACIRLGFPSEVRSACRLVYMPVDHLGTLSPITVVAALATVLQWHPGQPTLKSLLQRSRRQPRSSLKKPRFPWFRPTSVVKRSNRAGKVLEDS